MGKGPNHDAATADSRCSSETSPGEKSVDRASEVTRRKIKTPKIRNSDFEFGAYYGLISIERTSAPTESTGRASPTISPKTSFWREASGNPAVARPATKPCPVLRQLLKQAASSNTTHATMRCPSKPGRAARRDFSSAAITPYNTALSGERGGPAHFVSRGRRALHHRGVNFGAGYRILMTNWLALHM